MCQERSAKRLSGGKAQKLRRVTDRHTDESTGSEKSPKEEPRDKTDAVRKRNIFEKEKNRIYFGGVSV